MKEYVVKVANNGDKYWYMNDKLHREDGPAIELSNGNKYWFMNGDLHRLDGPAVEYANGYKAWYMNGDLHREDGPAMEYANGSKYWYINGKQITKKEFDKRKQSCHDKIVTIDGKQYKLEEVKGN